jgi:GNAT superfamily N-acetyltransferase
MRTANAELVESLHQFITIWRLIGKPFPQVDGTDRPALAISWPNTRFPFYNFLFMVATAPDSRRKGYGEAVMRRALSRLPLYYYRAKSLKEVLWPLHLHTQALPR